MASTAVTPPSSLRVESVTPTQVELRWTNNADNATEITVERRRDTDAVPVF